MLDDKNLNQQAPNSTSHLDTRGFDNQLDRLSKISTILIGVLGFLATAYTTIYIIYPGHVRDTAKICFDHQREVEKSFEVQPLGEIEPLKIGLTQICKITSDEAEKFLITAKTKAQAFADSNLRFDTKVNANKETGYVSLGKTANYQTSNFRNVKNNNEKALKTTVDLKLGTILKARWSVNLRENFSDIDKGKNPVKSIIYDEECVRMEENLPKPKRGSYWVNVSLVECP